MRTWSLESAFIRAYSAAAVAVQSVIDAAGMLERIARPVRRDAESEDGEPVNDDPDLDEMVIAECRRVRRDRARAQRIADDPGCVFPSDGADQLAEAEEQQEVWEPYGSVYDDDDRFPPAPDWHNAQDRLCAYALDDDINDSVSICGVCRPVRDIVEQMIEERFGSQVDKADTVDAEMWRAYVDPQSTPAAGAAGSSPSVDDGHSPVPPTEGRSRWDDCGGGPW